MRLRRAATACVLVTGAVFALSGATPAAAATDKQWYSVVSSDAGAIVGFRPYGEHLKVCDMRKDGRYPGVKYQVDNGRWINKRFKLGAGNCKVINLDLPESSYIRFQAVNYEKGKAVAHSRIRKVSARG